MTPIVYFNGEFLLEKKALIPVNNRGFLFGEGVFTTIKVKDAFPELLRMHLHKLKNDCESLNIVPPNLSYELIHELINELIQRNHADVGTWRLKIILSGGIKGQFLITLKPYVADLSPCRLVCYPFPICHPLARVKSLAFFHHLLVADYAKKQGFDDALVLDYQGMVLETSVANVFWRQGYDLFFPDPELFLYEGITLQVVRMVAEKMGWKTHPVQMRLKEISESSQFFICNSMREVVSVVSIDARTFKRDLSFEQDLYDGVAHFKLTLGV